MTMLRDVQGLGARAGIWIDKTSDVDSVRKLVRELRPKTGSKALVRIGPEGEGDGGYLIPDDLDGVSLAISPGVSNECSFDLDLANRGIDVIMADASVQGPPLAHERFRFRPLFLDTYSSDTTITLADLVTQADHLGDKILQMDIEGAEWRVINSTPEDVIRQFRIIVLECHDLVNLFSRFGIREITAAFCKLLRTHEVIHIHPNNVSAAIKVAELTIPSLMEFTFHRKDRDDFKSVKRQFPSPLDRKNIAHRPDMVLPLCWQY